MLNVQMNEPGLTNGSLILEPMASLIQHQPPPPTCMAWTWEQAMNLPQNYHQYFYQAMPEFEESYEREHMFEKLLTPSDVGKLNRLVIPKQHAEKYFPLDGESAERGLLMSFEDGDSGKAWRFRYSYWSSSQSYVLTKGWRRFVKEKKLDAGDVIVFERQGLTRLYIGCRCNRAGDSPLPPSRRAVQDVSVADDAAMPWNPLYYHRSLPEDHAIHEGNMREEEVQNEASAPAKSKQFRLFGVDFECRPEQPAAANSWFSGHSALHLTESNSSSSQL